MFTIGYSACFLSAIKPVGPRSKISVPAEAPVTAEVGIGLNDRDGFGPAIELRASLSGMKRNTAHTLMAQAHEVYPYSDATRGNVEVKLVLA